MKHWTTPDFWYLYRQLTKSQRKKADERFDLLKKNERSSTVRLKQVNKERQLYSARSGQKVRSIGYLSDDGIVWFWIGSHDEYDKLIND